MQGQQKQVLVVWLAGGLSQLESWDPKPHTETGGPFRAIETSVPGIMISELLPRTARLMHRLALVRGLNTTAATQSDHGKGHYLMHTGRPQSPGQEYPHLGSVMAKWLGSENDPLPGYIHITPGGGGSSANDAAFLGPKYGALYLGNGQAPANTQRPGSVSEAAEQARQSFRCKLNDRFAAHRRTAETTAYTTTYDQARQLMERREVFDASKEPVKDQERYGTFDFGRHCLLARRLLEAGVTFVQVSHSNYDTHNENFSFHLEQLGEFDQGFSNLIDDLAARGLLERTLVVVMSEFGRTPTVNYLYGRDHWDAAWSVALAGGGIKPGVVHGKTNDKGTEVVDGQVNAGHLFHTYMRAVGIDPSGIEVDGRPIQLADPAARPIKELLA
jgi:arylsulfatase A-like enzyme